MFVSVASAEEKMEDDDDDDEYIIIIISSKKKVVCTNGQIECENILSGCSKGVALISIGTCILRVCRVYNI